MARLCSLWLQTATAGALRLSIPPALYFAIVSYKRMQP